MTEHGFFFAPVAARKTSACEPFRWQLTESLIFRSKVYGTIIVPKGFEMDFASVPRLWFAYAIFGNRFHEAAVVHDWLYSVHGIQKREVTREEADDAMRQAILACGYSAGFAHAAYLAVRLGGGSAWSKERNLDQSPDVVEVMKAQAPDLSVERIQQMERIRQEAETDEGSPPVLLP